MTAKDEKLGEREWTAQWCTTRKHRSRPWNTFAQHRRVFELTSRPRAAVVRVSADARYTLYVNGRRINHGPARSYPAFQSYDTLDLADHLVVGMNCIAAITHQFGVPTFLSVYRDISGFLLDGVVETDNGEVALHTPEGWLCRKAKGWRQDVARLSVQMGFQEHFDADADPIGWMLPDYAATEEGGWFKPFALGRVGIHPWLRMEPRGVPLLSATPREFAAVIAQFRGENARGYKVSDDVYHLPVQEQRKFEKSILESPQAMLKNDDNATTIAPPSDGEFVGVVLDLAQYRTGHLMLDIAEASGDEIIDVLYAEEIDRNGFLLLAGGDGKPTHSEEATATRYRCRPGAQTWETFHYFGMRYAAVIFRNVEKPLKIRHIGIRQVHADVPDAGSFECSDAVLNDIWRVGRETQRNCIFDSFVDCPWREQAQWWGDARVQARVTLFSFGDVSLLQRGIRQMAQSQAYSLDGSLHAHPPADIPGHRLPDFMMTWIGSLWDHHLHTGQTALLVECLPVLHRLLEMLEQHELQDGLIGDFDDWWVFLDWQNLHKKNFSAVLNMMYLQALRWAADICEAAGDAQQAKRCAHRADSLAQAIENHFWDKQAKLWRDGFDPDTGKLIDSVSQHANALAILLNLKPDTHAALARDVLLKCARAKKSKILGASPFFYAYVLEAMSLAGLREEVVEIIRDKWGGMIDRGAVTFWEMWDVTLESRCHAWSASPVYHLMQEILGVTPAEPGWKRVRIAPLPAGLDFARGVIPSPAGPIRVEWEKVEEDQLAVRVDLPEGMTAEFVSPLGATRTIGAGKNEFQT